MLRNDFEYIFWDWDGTLSLQQYFWPVSIKTDPELAKLSGIWQRPQKSDPWLRGKETLEDLRKELGCSLSVHELENRLVQEWPDESTINKPLFSAISALYPDARHIIITDNMDVFNAYARSSPFIKQNIQKVYNSFDYKVTKGDKPSLFEIAKNDLGIVNFQNTLLLDDSPLVCETFRQHGGNSIHITRNQRT